MADVELTVKQAAEKLGITPRAVRERLTTGKLKGRKVEGRRGNEWRVLADAAGLRTRKRGGKPDAKDAEASLREKDAEIARLQALLEERSARVEDLRAMVGHWETRLERHEVLLQQTLRMLPQAAPPVDHEEVTRQEAPPAPWWRRLFGR